MTSSRYPDRPCRPRRNDWCCRVTPQQQQPFNNPYNSRGGDSQACDPVAFKSKDGNKKGWKVVIPGSCPLATPAVVDGKVFLGGGFWQSRVLCLRRQRRQETLDVPTPRTTAPTAAAVADGYVALLNTLKVASLEVLTVKGEAVWKKWLGDPLMSNATAVAGGKVYMAYPGTARATANTTSACLELKDGKELWKHEIVGEIITAPVIDKRSGVPGHARRGRCTVSNRTCKLAWQRKEETPLRLPSCI